MEKTKSVIHENQVADLEALIFGRKPIWTDGIFITGLVLTFLSGIIFLFPDFAQEKFQGDDFFGVFFFNYALAVCYFFVLLCSGLLRFRWTLTKNYTENIFLFLILSLISSFSLNRSIPIFEESATWLTVSLVGLGATLIAVCFRRHFPRPVVTCLYFLLGAGLVLYLYFSFYLLPFYPIGLIAGIALGISLHVFIPLISLLFVGVHLLRAARSDKQIAYAGLAGIAAPLVVLGFFLINWQVVKSKLNYALNAATMEEHPLPNWITISRQLPKTPIAEKLVKTDLVYSTPREHGWSAFDLPSRSFTETRRHDPLVMISCLLLGKPELTETERIKILEAMYDSRHQALERLWSGNDLQTANVVSNVRIYPDYRMAYTEKILSIKNNASWDRNQQEAIYTFHLPEGGVVTSLSLWINGYEEKGILTTKAQADSAYKTIVGVESRDPSVVHWQEGNTVSVRVFPCTPEENRKFKIGVTAPLRKEGNTLTYQNIYFDGPAATKGTESVRLQFTQEPEKLELPFSFKKDGNGFISDSYFRNYWEVSFAAPALSERAFVFDGRSYQVQDYRKKLTHFKPQTIYLDLNNSWEKDELMDLWDEIKDQPVYTFQDKMERLTGENLAEVFAAQQQQNFSLFPLHQIKDPQNALVISKSNALSPNLKDLQGSVFSSQLTNVLRQPQKIRLYNLGEELSPYLKTLKELRVFTYDQGSVDELTALLKEQKFVLPQENSQTVVINNAGLKLVETFGEKTESGAPDHLLRLFAYNHLMQQICSNYFTNNFISAPLLAEAQKAYVISPLSSLVVLETQKDYDRFNIKDSKNASLRNASMHGSGSVPEPHEWFLIIMVASVAVYLYFRPNLIAKTRL